MVHGPPVDVFGEGEDWSLASLQWTNCLRGVRLIRAEGSAWKGRSLHAAPATD
jgi:hypothetical protein